MNDEEYRFLRKEIDRLGAHNLPEPEKCDKCGSPLQSGRGMVGETVLYCEEHGIQWEDSEDAIRRVL